MSTDKELRLEKILEDTYKLQKLNEYGKAVDYVSKNLKTFENEIQVLYELYYVQIENYFYLGEIEKALETGKALLHISKELNNIKDITKANLLVGEVYHISGNLKESVIYYKNAYNLIKNEKENFLQKLKEETIYSLANLNQHYLGNFEQSKRLYLEALEITKLINPQKQSFYLDHLGMASLELDQYEQALGYHSKAEPFLVNKNDISYLYHQVQVAKVYFKLENYNQSISELLKFLEPNREFFNDFKSIYDFGWIFLILANISSKKVALDNSKVSKVEKLLNIKLNDTKELYIKALEYASQSKISKSLLITTKIDLVQYLQLERPDSNESKILLREAIEDAEKRQYIPLLERAKEIEHNLR